MSLFGSMKRFWPRPARRVVAAPSGPLIGRYDAAQTTDRMGRHWANADALDADSANRLEIRKKLRERMRYELANNPHARGILLTHANYVIGTGPRLRMQSRSIGFNQMVEADWSAWCAASGFAHKLRLLFLAKVGDGEAVARLISNPAIESPVTLDVFPIECDYLTAPLLFYDTDRYVDGISFDAQGNPISYDLLTVHPGAAQVGFLGSPSEFERVPAEFILHWFRADRPGQHRGVPELTPSLNLFGQGRRHREAVLSAAEAAASLAVILAMGPTNQDNDVAVPFSTFPLESGMAVAGPAGATPVQMRPEQPSTTHEMLMRQIISEEARPLNMPYNIAAADNSNQNFSGGRLNHHTYFVSIDVERSQAEHQVVDRVFRAWFAERSRQYRAGGFGSELPEPRHAWSWPAMPQIDDAKTATARKNALGVGATRLGLLWAEDGLDFEDELPLMAAEYGLSPDEMRARLLGAIFPEKTIESASPAEESNDLESPARNGAASSMASADGGRVGFYLRN